MEVTQVRPATSTAGGVPTSPLAGTVARETRRGAPDRVARRLLMVPERRSGEVYNIFSSSILLSASRCLLSYIVFPVLAPWLGALPVVGPAVGIPVAVAALVFDVRAVRKFFLADHRWRWAATGLYLLVMGMVSYLLVRDISHLA